MNICIYMHICLFVFEEKSIWHSNLVMTLKHLVFVKGLFINNSLIHDFKPLKIFSFIHAFAPKNIHKNESKSFVKTIYQKFGMIPLFRSFRGQVSDKI